MRILGSVMFWALIAAVVIVGQAKPNRKLNSQPTDLKSECIGSHMRLTLDKALATGNQLEIEAISDIQQIVLTPSLAAQCGYSMESDPWGNTRIYTSLLGCYIGIKDDKVFDVGMRLHVYSDRPSDVVTYEVNETCRYSAWATREIVCDRNYMEVSNYQLSKIDTTPPKGPAVKDDLNTNILADILGLWKITFYTPEPTVMPIQDAEDAGYGVMYTNLISKPHRLVVRSPYNTAETYSDNVAGVPMEVFRASVYYATPTGLKIVEMAAACPTGGVTFTDDVISWHIPRHVTPLIDGGIKIVEMHMGINGQRLDRPQMAARGYTLSATEHHVVVELQLGSPDGYFKSHAPDYQYHLTYTIEPMVELLWTAKDAQSTRYKVFYPITTPLMPWYPQTYDETVPENRMFIYQLGTFLHDVVLVNITFPTGVLSAAECDVKGFLQEQTFPNGSKVFALQVPFSDAVVLQHNPEPLVTVYHLPLVYGFMVLPEQTPFSYSVVLEASLQDVVLPTITGTCDEHMFHVTVKYGSQGLNFQTMVGTQTLTPEMAKGYGLIQNGTHCSLSLPYTSLDIVFEYIDSSSVKARLDMMLWEPTNNWALSDFSLACNFPLITTRCYSNGTMTAVTAKLESVPNLDTARLTLKDKLCKPFLSDDRFAHFAFSGDSCGTSRTFFDNYLVYENEISLDSTKAYTKAYTSPPEPEFRHKISCYYLVNGTETLAFHYKPRVNEPTANIGSGQLMVQMRLAQDETYELFYETEDYPVEKTLRQPVYFEVELMHSTDPQLELILENCWATLHEERTSLPSWDLIVDGCLNTDDSYVTIFHPIVGSPRVVVPSHFKRFSMKMFSFVKDKEVLKDQIYVHCDAVICDLSNGEGICSGQCVNPGVGRPLHTKGQRVQRADSNEKLQTTSGPILFTSEHPN